MIDGDDMIHYLNEQLEQANSRIAELEAELKERTVNLSEAGAEKVFDAIDNPPYPNENLKDLSISELKAILLELDRIS